MTVDVAERDRMAVAAPETLRAAGLDVDTDHADCARPGPSWVAEIERDAQRARQMRAIMALQHLTPADVAALLEALHAR